MSLPAGVEILEIAEETVEETEVETEKVNFINWLIRSFLN